MSDRPSQQDEPTRASEQPLQWAQSDGAIDSTGPGSNQDGRGSDTDELLAGELLSGDGGDPFVPEGEQPTVISARKPDAAPIDRISSREIGAALVGSQLHNYHLDEFVGGGGMGAVFRATDTVLGRTVAVKVMARIQPNEDLTRRFINEAQSAAQLDHENIARVHNAGHADGLNYIVFEFVRGENLRERVVREGPMPFEEALTYTLKIADALDHASERNVIHRDIKPSNVIINDEGKLKLVDMGLARMNRVDADDPELTASGMTLGTFDYLSPEQASDPRQADVRSDLYSLGCTLFFMVTGQPPFPDGTPVQKLIAHREGRRPDPRKMRGDVPPGLVQIIRKLMAPRPGNRFQHPTELIAALTLLGRQWGMTLNPPVTSQELSRYLHRRSWVRWSMPVAIPALLLLLVVFSVEMLRGNAGAAPDLVDPTYARELAADDSARSPQPSSDSPADTSGGNDANIDDGATNDPGGPTGSSTEGESVESLIDGANSDSTGRSIPFFPGTRLDEDRNVTAGSDSDSSGDVVASGDGPSPSTVEEPVRSIDPAEIQRLVVGRTDALDNSDTLSVDSLRMAIAQREMYPNLQVIELRKVGPHTLDPFEYSGDSLVIRGSSGIRPLLVVDMTVDDSRPVIGLTGQRMEFDGIDWAWSVPNATSVPRWSLFRMKQDRAIEGSEQALKFRDCTFTTLVSPGPGATAEAHVSLVRVDRPDVFEFESSDATIIVEPPSIQLENCAFRGSAFLVTTIEVTPFVLAWNQGLFVSDQALIECRGSSVARSEFAELNLLLSDLTLVADRGLARLFASELYPQQLKLDVLAERCVFEVADDVPLVRRVGPELIDVNRAISWSGEFNFVPASVPLWSFRLTDDVTPVEEITPAEAQRRQLWNAADVFEVQSRVKWESPPESRPSNLEEAERDHFFLLPDQGNLAYQYEAGFDPLRLPAFPKLRAAGGGMLPMEASNDDPISMPNEFDMETN